MAEDSEALIDKLMARGDHAIIIRRDGQMVASYPHLGLISQGDSAEDALAHLDLQRHKLFVKFIDAELHNEIPKIPSDSNQNNSYLKLTIVSIASTTLTLIGITLFIVSIGIVAGPPIASKIAYSVKNKLVEQIGRLDKLGPERKRELHFVISSLAKFSAEFVNDLRPIILSIEKESSPILPKKSSE